MPCLIGCLALAFPRVAIVLVVIFSDYIGNAYQTTFWPLLGFFFMPLSTLGYAYAVNAHGGLNGLGAAVFVIAVREPWPPSVRPRRTHCARPSFRRSSSSTGSRWWSARRGP